VLDDTERLSLAAMAAAGARKIDAAARLSMSPDTLRRILRDDEAAAMAWAVGRSELHQKLISKLIERALAGEVVPMLFCLKAMFSYREGEPLDGEERGPLVQIVLPGALSEEEYLRTVTVGVRAPAELAERADNE
jgi:hypothetical protein